jgi:hypothetical protein
MILSRWWKLCLIISENLLQCCDSVMHAVCFKQTWNVTNWQIIRAELQELRSIYCIQMVWTMFRFIQWFQLTFEKGLYYRVGILFLWAVGEELNTMEYIQNPFSRIVHCTMIFKSFSLRSMVYNLSQMTYIHYRDLSEHSEQWTS